jgi:two-component system alkaline phosphatase synthesis response regulator PhoP
MTVIYIVEDDSNIRQMESYALKNSGYEVAECSDGSGFWTLCRTVLPDLVVLDIMLPGEDGLSILRRLRDNPATRRIPVIIVSAKSTELDTVTGLDTGADDYITKPFGV